jgi:hypothetical protein
MLLWIWKYRRRKKSHISMLLWLPFTWPDRGQVDIQAIIIRWTRNWKINIELLQLEQKNLDPVIQTPWLAWNVTFKTNNKLGPSNSDSFQGVWITGSKFIVCFKCYISRFSELLGPSLLFVLNVIFQGVWITGSKFIVCFKCSKLNKLLLYGEQEIEK